LANAGTRNNRGSTQRGRGQGPRRTQRRKFIPRRKVCAFCTEKTNVIDYKQPERLRRFVSDRGKIKPRRRTGTCAKHQRRLAVAIKRARHLALLPYVAEHLRRYS
jgi:small subunit ribosomal protein S18